MKVTPAHDPNDFEAGKRHNLPLIQVIDENAQDDRAPPGAYAGLDRFEARKRIVADLRSAGAARKDRALQAEPRQVPSLQDRRGAAGFHAVVREDEAAGRARHRRRWRTGASSSCPRTGSRPITSGWTTSATGAFRGNSGGVIAFRRGIATTAIRSRWRAKIRPGASHCGSDRSEQDTDVLDTWFSSGLWPFSTLGWPDQTADLRAFYPTSLLITGFDILFFWVARMIDARASNSWATCRSGRCTFMGWCAMPTSQKMSKTKGNVIDPLVVNEKYGTDAVRMALLQGAAPGTDIAFTHDRMDSARAFANKIWNAARFLFMNMERCGRGTVADAQDWMQCPDLPDGGRAARRSLDLQPAERSAPR